MSLNIYSSLSREKGEFKPQVSGKVSMYVCGITVYDYCHVGHARMLVAFDIIYRHLKYCGYEVKYVRNITDVDDKIFARANENGEDYRALSERFIGLMHEDEKALNIERPVVEPRATGFMNEIVELIARLEEKGVAYQGTNGDVFFAIDKFDDYGKLSGRKPEELLVGARVEEEKAKHNPLDFVLWKMAKEGEASWDSPWGKGRPGWHIECSAMSTACLGETLDIHGGGSDLLFPHHENEIAQSEAATGKTFANYWMHCGPVRVNKEKMSKSLGNFFTIKEVLENYHPEVLRYFLSSSHYRSPINYSEENLKLAKKELDKFYQVLASVDEQSGSDSEIYSDDLQQKFDAAMNDDFNSAQALAVMFELVKQMSTLEGNQKVSAGYQLQGFGHRLGFLFLKPDDYFHAVSSVGSITEEEIGNLIKERNQARDERNWSRADEIRDQLLENGVVLEDGGGVTTWKRK